MRRSRVHSLICVWAASTIATSGCRPPAPTTVSVPARVAAVTPTPTTTSQPSPTARPQIAFETTAAAGALTIRLPDTHTQTATDAVATTLSVPETQALLARLEPLRDLTAKNAVAPSLRPASLPPSRSGPGHPIAFVVPHGKPVADGPIAPRTVTAPLVPPQISPQDEVYAESEVRVRFGEPMVVIAVVGTPAKPPATITPPLAGTWRWIDTRVATFTATNPRFPKATSFVVTVPAGIRALSGATLVAPAVSTFTTQAVQISADYPSAVLRPDSPIVVQFDQAIDADAIVRFLRIETTKGKPLAFKPIALADARRLWERNPSIGFDPTRAGTLLGPNHVILAPLTAWPAGIEAQVALKIGAPSKEGPRVTTRESFAQFQVAAPFTVSGISCHRMTTRMAGATCPAKGYFEVEFSNSMTEASYRSSKVQIEGQPFQDRATNGTSVSLWAPEVVGRHYAIAVGDGLVDVYGQPLTGPRRPTFTTGPERFDPYVRAPTGLIVLDPRFAIPQWVIVSEAIATLRVELYKVEPTDYFAFEDLEGGTRSTPPGKRISDKSYVVGPRHGANLRVDLRPALDASGLGHVIAVATATAVRGEKDFQKRHVAWMQVTKLGVTARIDGERVSAWVKDIAPAHFLQPTANATASILVEGAATAPPSGVGDAEGHVVLELPPAGKPRLRTPTALLHIQAGTDTTFTAIDKSEKSVRRDEALWYVTDDRFTYKPGETLYLKGWVRWTHSGVNPDLDLPRPNETVTYTLTDARGNKLTSGTATLGAQGGFDAELAIPATANLGNASISFKTGTGVGRVSTHYHPIAIQEFRTPAYAVTLNDDVSHSGATALYLGETVEMTAAAKYYSGGGLGGATLAWDATLATANYRPPNWNQFSFAPPRNRSTSYYAQSHHTSHQTTTLSGASAASIVWGLVALAGNRPSVLTVDTTVTDVDRASIRATSRSILVHPSTYYVGLRQRPGAGVLEFVVTDVDGALVPGVPIEVTIEGVLGSERDRDDAKIVDTQRCAIASGSAPVTCPFTRLDNKTAYRAIARVADARGRRNAALYDIPWWSRADGNQDLVVIPDRAAYRPGDVAKLEIRSSVTPATAIVSFARQGIILQKRVELATASTVVELPIEPAYIQNVHVIVDRIAKRIRQESGSAVALPEQVSFEVDLPVDVESARLVMTTRPIQSIVQPGAQATFEVEVRHDGKPKPGAEVALLVVDEAILALSTQMHADPLPLFYRKVAAGSSQRNTFTLVDDSGDTLSGVPGFTRFSLDSMGPGGGGTGWGTIGTGRYGTIGHGSGTGSGSAIVESRKDFRATAVFSPRLMTDANGKARLSVKMPDSLTRYRVVAIATANTRYFGKAESTIVTQRRINARTVAPRFLSQGDAFALPIVVQNLDTTPRTIDVAVRAANLVAIGPSGKRITVPGGQRAEVRFDFTTKARGRALVQTIVTSADFADASEVELPVYEPATTESFATYGVVDDAPSFEQLAVPADLFADVGGVDVELASTQLQSLTDAYWYLYAYPYECAEQRSGRMIATAAMFDVLDAFATPGRPTKPEIDDQRKLDMRALGKDQQPDGGWGYFSSMQSDPFVTIQVLTALALQRVSGPMTTRATVFVTRQANQLLDRLERTAALPAARRADRDQHGGVVSLASAALTALAATGVDVRPRAERLHTLATALAAYPMDAKARLLAVVSKLDRAKLMRQQLLAAIVSATHETASSATVTTTYQESERLLLVSSTKTSALALDAMMREAPEHALVTKLARGVLDGRRHGRWGSTQENLVALQTMRRYFDTYEKVTPNFTGKLWFGGAAYAEQPFVGRSGKRGTAHVGWPALPLGSSHDIALVKDGPGRMYYRVGITYAPKRADLPPLDAGFLVRRSYLAVDDPADVTKTASGWKIKLGAKVQVVIEAINTTKRYSVALVDPLPAGFEAINENLAIAERGVRSSGDDRWDFINLRDNRSEAFSMDLDEGSHRFSYTVRATTPGTFLAAPAKAEEMYSPETFGRSAGQTVLIQ